MADLRPKHRDTGTEESAFLASYDASVFPRPSVAVDVVLMTIEAKRLRVLLTMRKEHPSKGVWSLPGTFVHPSERLLDAAERVIQVKTGLRGIFVEQLYTFDAIERDPRTRVISVAYFALAPATTLAASTDRMTAGTRVSTVRTEWSGEEGGPAEVLDDAGTPFPVAFDHAEILGTAVKRLRGRIKYSPVGYELLAQEFTLRQLQEIHETILDRPLNKDAFRRRMLATGQLEATGRLEDRVGHRPAELYRYVPGRGNEGSENKE